MPNTGWLVVIRPLQISSRSSHDECQANVGAAQFRLGTRLTASRSTTSVSNILGAQHGARCSRKLARDELPADPGPGPSGANVAVPPAVLHASVCDLGSDHRQAITAI